MEYKKMDSTG